MPGMSDCGRMVVSTFASDVRGRRRRKLAVKKKKIINQHPCKGLGQLVGMAGGSDCHGIKQQKRRLKSGWPATKLQIPYVSTSPFWDLQYLECFSWVDEVFG